MKLTKYILPLLFVGALSISLSSCVSSAEEDSTSNQEAQSHDTETGATPLQSLSGIYLGLLPCADCEGISTAVELTPEGKFSWESTYIKGDAKETFTDTGLYTIEGEIVTFETTTLGADGTTYEKNGESRQARIEGDKLRLLDIEGNPIEDSELAEMYVLEKAKTVDPTTEP